MFQRTFATLGKTVGWRKPRPDTHESAESESDRRIWVRYPCELDATCQPANRPDAVRLSARVRNISRGGINFLLNCPVESGSLLSVELPGIAGKTVSTVLAYVVRVESVTDGEWSIGCTFATELGNEDLAPFGVSRVQSKGTDKRTWVRFPCNIKASYQFVKAEEPTSWSAEVVNMSANGIGLLVNEGVDLGKLLNLELRAERGDYVLNILACVVRLTPEVDGSHCTLGCNLIRELTNQETKLLLGD
jgi:hypothetical protein